jgi:hypothetical protein
MVVEVQICDDGLVRSANVNITMAQAAVWCALAFKSSMQLVQNHNFLACWKLLQ